MKAGEWRRKGNFSSSSREGTVGTLFRFSVGDGTRWALSIGRPGYPFQVLGAQKCMPWLELASPLEKVPEMHFAFASRVGSTVGVVLARKQPSVRPARSSIN
jgi:hypothetical protein